MGCWREASTQTGAHQRQVGQRSGPLQAKSHGNAGKNQACWAHPDRPEPPLPAAPQHPTGPSKHTTNHLPGG